jgi:uncharacterized Fe-S cluster protein YjdI
VHTKVQAIVALLRGSDDEELTAYGSRLGDCVQQPLAKLRAADPPTTGEPVAIPAGSDWRQQVWELARAMTEQLRGADAPAELRQAAAGLQDLACELADADVAASRATELASIDGNQEPCLQTVADGPYLLSGVDNLVDALGERMPSWPRMTLCRCGASAAKPSCDGACVRTGFTDGKEPNRVADRRDSYVGQQVQVLDNRGICQHSGYCTDRLASVFHLGEEPFVTPSGGRMDEIIRAVRDCPSGALSYAVDGVEAREQVDYGGQREPTVVVWGVARQGRSTDP